MAFHSGTPGNVPVSGTIDDSPGENCLTAFLGLDDHTLDVVTFLDDIGAEHIHEQFHPGIVQHPEQFVLGGFRLYYCEAHVIAARLVFRCGTPGPHPVDERLRQALDDLIAFPSEKSENRESYGQITSDISPAFDEHHPEALPCRSACGHDTCGTCSHDQNIHFCPHRGLPGWFFYSQFRFHFLFQRFFGNIMVCSPIPFPISQQNYKIYSEIK